jgi:hypothetical protein
VNTTKIIVYIFNRCVVCEVYHNEIVRKIAKFSLLKPLSLPQLSWIAYFIPLSIVDRYVPDFPIYVHRISFFLNIHDWDIQSENRESGGRDGWLCSSKGSN